MWGGLIWYGRDLEKWGKEKWKGREGLIHRQKWEANLAPQPLPLYSPFAPLYVGQIRAGFDYGGDYEQVIAFVQQ